VAQPLMITGIVTDPSGRPVPGAGVLLTEAPVPVPDIAALTGPDGRFSIIVPETGDYRVAVHAQRASADVAVTVTGGDSEIAVELPA
jgi:hypothetical protein